MDSLLRNLINLQDNLEIKKQALKEGLKTLRQDAVYKAIKGITTIDEVERITIN